MILSGLASIPRAFYTNGHLLWLTVTVVLVAGLSSLLTIPRIEDPRITNRNAVIVTPFPGATAERVEALVTDVVESAVDELGSVRTIESTSRSGVSSVSVEFDDSVTNEDNSELFAELRDLVDRAATEFPPEAGPPVVDDKREPVAFALVLGVTWDDDSPPDRGLLSRLAEELADRLRRIPGTELVRVYGEATEEITITLARGEIATMNLDVQAIAQRLSDANARVPAGTAFGGTVDIPIEVTGDFETIERVKAVPIATSSDGSVLRLGDIARVEKGWREPIDELGVIDGRHTVFVAARVETSAFVGSWTERAKQVADDFADSWGHPIAVESAFEQAPYTTERLNELGLNLLAGVGVVLAAIWMIMGLRAALIIAVALPLSVALVHFGWNVSGTQIQQMSVFGLILALGLLIDNAIVVTDEVMARLDRGDRPLEALQGTIRHLLGPLSASTLTTVLAFLPITLLPGGPGDFVGSIGTSVILALVASFVISITVIAALTARFGSRERADDARRRRPRGLAPKWITRPYRRLLGLVGAAPLAAAMIAVSPAVAGFAVAGSLGSQFFPPVDRNMFEIRVWLQSGVPAELTHDHTRRVEASLRRYEGVERVSWMIGGSHPSVYYNLVMGQDGAQNFAQAIVTTTSPEATKRLVEVAERDLTARHPELQVVARPFAQGPPVAADIEYRLLGPDPDELHRLGERVRTVLQNDPAVLLTQASIQRGEPKAVYAIDEDSARSIGITPVTAARQIDAALSGVVGGSILEDLEDVPVRIRYDDEWRRAPNRITSVLLSSPESGEWTSASALGDISLKPQPGGISRYNGQRTNTILAYTRSDALPIDVNARVLAQLEVSDFELPAGYTLETGGATEEDARARQGLIGLIPVISTLGLATLILAFRSIALSLLLCSIAGLSLGLALLSTWAIQFPISFNTLLGTLGLIGVALNDSIVVLAAIRGDDAARRGDREAIVDVIAGCSRHIIATTVTTAGAFLPLLVFVGGDFWPSIAVVLAGGIVGASLLALIFVPASYLLLIRIGVPLGGREVTASTHSEPSIDHDGSA